MSIESRINALECRLDFDPNRGIITAELFEATVARFKKAVWAMQNIRPIGYSDQQARIDAKRHCESFGWFRGFAEDVNLTSPRP